MCDSPLLRQKGMTLCEPSATLPAFKVATLQTLRYLIEEPRTKDDLYKVVDNEHSPKIHRFPVLHDPGAEHFNEVGVAETDRQRWERTAHQQPVIHTWICKQSHVSSSQFMRNGRPVHASRVAGSQSVSQAGDSHYSHQYNGRQQRKLNSKHLTVYSLLSKLHSLTLCSA